MSYIFISYSHKEKDKKYVEKLEEALRNEGFDVWIDHRIDYGSQWTEAIENAIDTCDAYMVIMSEDAKKSPWVQREVIHAERRKKPFFPLLLSGDYWFSLGNIQFVDVRHGSLPPEKFYKDLESVTLRKKIRSNIHPDPDVKSKAKQKLKIPKSTIYLRIVVSLFVVLVVGVITIWVFLNMNNFIGQFQLPASEPIITSTGTHVVNPTSIIENATKTPNVTHTPSTTSTPELGVGSTWTRPADGMVMMYIPAGEFQMGSEYGEDDEKPVHMVNLDAFWMDQTEVTNSQFRIFVEEKGYQTEAEMKGWSLVYTGLFNKPWEEYEEEGANWLHPQGPSSSIVDLDNHPVLHVSWNEARRYCEWAGMRLPTEAEWEKAARGGLIGAAYPWGDIFYSSQLNFCDRNCPLSWADKNTDDGYAYTSPVANFSPNGYGLYDMVGNVWELVADWYDSEYYANSPVTNPLGPSTGKYRVMRGGAWYLNYYDVRSAKRNKTSPIGTSNDLGFRCARTAVP